MPYFTIIELKRQIRYTTKKSAVSQEVISPSRLPNMEFSMVPNSSQAGLTHLPDAIIPFPDGITPNESGELQIFDSEGSTTMPASEDRNSVDNEPKVPSVHQKQARKSNFTPPVVDEEDSPADIQDPIEKRWQTKVEEGNENKKPKLMFFLQNDSPGHPLAQIEIPRRGKTKKIEMTRNEAYLLQTVFTSSYPYTREEIELKLVDIARTKAFEQIGGFEKVFNALNIKLSAWRICLTFNEEGQIILSDVKTTPPTIISPIDRSNEAESLDRFEGKQRHRRPYHGKLRL
jgi:hypothetical protein